MKRELFRFPANKVPPFVRAYDGDQRKRVWVERDNNEIIVYTLAEAGQLLSVHRNDQSSPLKIFFSADSDTSKGITIPVENVGEVVITSEDVQCAESAADVFSLIEREIDREKKGWAATFASLASLF